jgi:hypothetical protein
MGPSPLHWIVALATAAIALMSSPASACICSPGGDPQILVLNTAIAFRGRVVSVQDVTRGVATDQRATLEVDQVLKGDLPPVVEFQDLGGPGCRASLTAGETGVFFGNRSDLEGTSGLLFADMCTLAFARLAGPALDRLEADFADAEAAIRVAPGAMAPLLGRAETLRRWRDHERALLAYRALAEAAPDLIAAQVGIARTLIAQRRAEDAMAVLEAARLRLGTHPDILAATALARVAMGDFQTLAQTDFRNADLSNVDLSGQSLRGADFSGAYLRSVDLGRSDLRYARFIGTRFHWVDMRQADLRGARLVAPIGIPSIAGADLRGARLIGVRFE